MEKLKEKPDSIEELLHDVFYTPLSPASYSGIDKVWQEVKNRGTPFGLTRKKVKEWLEQQETYMIHRRAKDNFPREKIIVGEMDEEWDADLMDMQALKKYNKGYSYIAIFIDLFSRYVWAEPMKTKNGPETLKTIQVIFALGRQPSTLRTDKGSEWMTSLVQNYLKSEYVSHIIAYNVYHANYAERVIRTLKGRLYRYFRENLTYKYIDVLDDLVDSYNDTVHSSIHMAPAKVNKDNEQQLYEKYYLPVELEREKTSIQYDFQVGDKVRIARGAHPFKKDFEEKWSEEVFEVYIRVPSHPPRYRIKDLLEEEIKGSFYTQELQKASVDENTVYRVAKVLRYRTKNKERQALVQWSGYPSKFDSWISTADLKNHK